MLIYFFILLLLGAFGCLIFGWKLKKWLLTMVAMIFFLVLAFQAFQIEVVSGGVTLVFHEIIIVYLAWAMSIVSFISTLKGVVEYRHELTEKKERETSG